MPNVSFQAAAVLDNINRVQNDNKLDPQTRNSSISKIRAQALADQLSNLFTQSHTVTIDGWTVTIQDMVYDSTTNMVELFGVTVRDANGHLLINFDPHQLYVNTPLLFPDLTGDVDKGELGRFRVDPAACILTDLLQKAGH
jgi:hypothetical protein